MPRVKKSEKAAKPSGGGEGGERGREEGGRRRMRRTEETKDDTKGEMKDKCKLGKANSRKELEEWGNGEMEMGNGMEEGFNCLC